MQSFMYIHIQYTCIFPYIRIVSAFGFGVSKDIAAEYIEAIYRFDKITLLNQQLISILKKIINTWMMDAFRTVFSIRGFKLHRQNEQHHQLSVRSFQIAFGIHCKNITGVARIKRWSFRCFSETFLSQKTSERRERIR